MSITIASRKLGILLVLGGIVAGNNSAAAFDRAAASQRAVAALVEQHGAGQRSRVETGVRQAAEMWRDSDGDETAFVDFALEQFIADPAALDATFGHFEYAMEMLDGHFTSMGRELRHYMDEDVGPIQPLDRLLAAYDPSAHVNEDMFGSRVGFAALLNFPAATLDERLRLGDDWTRRRWAEVRLVDRFRDRVPADVQQHVNAATAAADAYISEYNLYLHHWLTEDGRRLFPAGLRLISHWGLRDELKSHYASNDPDALTRQRMIAQVMEHIVHQTIPTAAINNPLVDWTPSSNKLAVSPLHDVDPPAGATATTERVSEPNTRYQMLLAIYRAMREVDPYTPDAPTAIQRSFDVGREIPVETVRTMFAGLFDSPTAQRVADLIAARLGRPLEPFDIWYAGFKARAAFEESELDAMTRKRYPTPQAFEADIPRILTDLGFTPDKAQMVAAHITVDPSRGAGHAFGASRRDDQAHLRTRVNADGMDYKGYNIAVHELGHNVEQVFSLNTIDHTLISGVPANAFTEALAFVFQERDLQLLGLDVKDDTAKHLNALESFWGTCEIGAVALVDIAVWEWMYAHPDATPAELGDATVRIASETWDRTFGKLMGGKKSTLLGIYSHMLAYPLYLANYPLGHCIAFQLEQHFATSNMAEEFERVCQLGRLTPDLWMRRAVGAPLSTQPLLEAADRAVTVLQGSAARGSGD